MHLETLRMFCNLVETRSFNRAADLHYVTQSAIRQALHHLERDGGTRLILRSRRTFLPTRAGETYHRHGREILRLAAELDRELQQLKTTAAGVIELAACYSIGLHQLPPLLQSFRREWPQIEVRVQYGSIDRVHGRVLDNVADLGLVCYPQQRRGLGIEPFRQERLMLVCHPHHPLAARAAVAVRDLAGHTLVAWNELHRSPFLRGVPKHQHRHFQPAHQFDEVELVKCMVELDAGVAILPEAVVRAEVAGAGLIAVPFENGGHTEPLGIIYRKKKLMSPPLNRLLQALRPPEPMAG